jgi:hypothetical protein
MKFKRPINILIGFLILMILIEMVTLIIQNRRLKAQIIALKKKVPHLIVGDYALPIEVIKINGEEEFINFNNNYQKTLLFILSSSCVPCDKNLIFWRRLGYQLRNKARILLISLGEWEDMHNLKSYLKVDIPIYIPENKEKFIQDYRIRNFSQTVLIDEKGKVEWIKANGLNADDYFKLRELVLKF